MPNTNNNPLKSAGSLVDEKEFAAKAKGKPAKAGGEAVNSDKVKLIGAVVCLLAAGALIGWQLELFGGRPGAGQPVPPAPVAASTGPAAKTPGGGNAGGAPAPATPEAVVAQRQRELEKVGVKPVRPSPALTRESK
jgi:hypothetical protein